MQDNSALHNTIQGVIMTIQSTIDKLTSKDFDKVLHAMSISQLQTMLDTILNTLPKQDKAKMARARSKAIQRARVKAIRS